MCPYNVGVVPDCLISNVVRTALYRLGWCAPKILEFRVIEFCFKIHLSLMRGSEIDLIYIERGNCYSWNQR